MRGYTNIDPQYKDKPELTIPEMTTLLAGYCPSILICDTTLIHEEDKASYEVAMETIKVWRESIETEIKRACRRLVWGKPNWSLLQSEHSISILNLNLERKYIAPGKEVLDYERCIAKREDFIRWMRDAIKLERVPLNTKELLGMVPKKPEAKTDTPADLTSKQVVLSDKKHSKEQSTKGNEKKGWTDPFAELDATIHSKYDKYLDGLTTQQYEVFLLKNAHSLTSTEIGKRLGVSRQRIDDVLAMVDTKLNRDRNKNLRKKQQTDEND